jgi:hypothetical protein
MNKDLQYIKSTFLKLTEHTYPYGYEDDLISNLSKVFPKKLIKDAHDNYFIKIGDSRTIFASHLDTACKDAVKVNRIIEGNIIKTDGKSILGADDKAGVTIMLWMINHNIPGLYYFFIGEEVGCIGSGMASKLEDIAGKFDRIISFDRRGKDSIITHQSGMRTCSDEFANSLAKQLNRKGLNLKKDDTGVYTDSAEFTSVIPECTNISVGYYKEHTFSENQDIKYLYLLADSCLSVDWENLPTKRDMFKTESKWDKYEENYNKQYYSNSHRENKLWDNSNYANYYSEIYYNRQNKNNNRKKRSRSKSFYDDGPNLIQLNISNDKIKIENNFQKYEPFKEKLINTTLSKKEIEIIKEQYLDLENPDDKNYYNILIKNYL